MTENQSNLLARQCLSRGEHRRPGTVPTRAWPKYVPTARAQARDHRPPVGFGDFAHLVVLADNPVDAGPTCRQPDKLVGTLKRGRDDSAYRGAPHGRQKSMVTLRSSFCGEVSHEIFGVQLPGHGGGLAFRPSHQRHGVATTAYPSAAAAPMPSLAPAMTLVLRVVAEPSTGSGPIAEAQYRV
jgi:hypothetical protein